MCMHEQDGCGCSPQQAGPSQHDARLVGRLLKNASVVRVPCRGILGAGVALWVAEGRALKSLACRGLLSFPRRSEN